MSVKDVGDNYGTFPAVLSCFFIGIAVFIIYPHGSL